MFKIKLLVGLASVMATFVALAVPAMAEFESANAKSQGVIKTFPAETTFESVEGGVGVKCKSTNAEEKVVAEGGWQIQVKGTTTQGKLFYQEPTTKGPHEQLKIKWGICTGPTGVAATVECNLQVESNGTNSSATGSPYFPGCNVKVGTGTNTCTIIVQPDGNKELQGTTVTNGVNGVKIEANTPHVSSVTQETLSLCKTLGIKGGQRTGKYFTKGVLETEGQKLV